MYGGMACDYPGCGLPIAQRCGLCSGTYCTRQIQWIGTQGSEGYDISGHYRCDLCSQQVAQSNTAYYGKLARFMSAGIVLLIVGALVVALAFPLSAVNENFGTIVGGSGGIGCMVGLFLVVGSMMAAKSRYH